MLKYLKGTQSFGIKYSKVSEFRLIGYSNSDFDGDKEHGVSTSGYLMNLGSTAITWRSQKQSVPVDSTTEAEYVAVAQATKEIIWLCKILEDLQEKQMTSTPLFLTNILQFNWSRIQNSMIKPNISKPNITWFNIMLRIKPFI